MRATIGTKGSKKIVAEYTHSAGSLPELHITGVGNFRGSSIGPSDPRAIPSVADVLYWQSLAGLPQDETIAQRVVARWNSTSNAK